MSNNKQTAVEFYREHLMALVSTDKTDFKTEVQIFEQAKEMDKRQQDLLNECEIQLEYLNQKFGETGTTNALLSKLKNK